MKPRENNAHRSPAVRDRSAPVSANNRSRLTNGSRLGIDCRTREGRRWRDLFRHYMAESGGRQEVLCKQLATLILQRERMDAALVAGEPVDALDLVRLCGAINRTMARAGLAAEPEAPPPDATDDAIAALRRTASC